MYTELNMYMVWISMQNIKKHKSSQKFLSWRLLVGWVHIWLLQCTFAPPVSFTILGLSKFENPGKRPWRPLEGTHTLVLRGQADSTWFISSQFRIWLYFACRVQNEQCIQTANWISLGVGLGDREWQ